MDDEDDDIRETIQALRRILVSYDIQHRPGVERLGQSVLMMRDRDAEDFIGLLSRLRVPYRRERIWVEG